jgi:hypothetical protein
MRALERVRDLARVLTPGASSCGTTFVPVAEISRPAISSGVAGTSSNVSAPPCASRRSSARALPEKEKCSHEKTGRARELIARQI